MLLSTVRPLRYACVLLRSRFARSRPAGDAPRDVGASIIEWVLITALLVIIATAVGGILLATITGAAENIDPTPSIGE